MGERVTQITTRIKELLGKMSRRLKVALVLVLLAIIGVIVGLSVYNATRPYTVLFTELSADDMTLIMTYFNDNNITDFRIRGDDTILVPESQEAVLKAAIYQQGYPTSGYGYDTYFDNIGMLSSESDRQALTRYQLQDRLSAIVRSFDGVKEAVVDITEGSDTTFILSSDNKIEASAHVQVTMQNGRVLTDKQVNAIRLAVSNSVKGLSIDSVSISDAEGNSYTSGSGDFSSVSDTASLKLALESQINETTRSNILDVLRPLFGTGNVNVSVNSTVDVSDTYREELQYIEPDWAADGSTMGQGIIGRRVWGNVLIRGEDGNIGGVVGTTTNADLTEYVVNEAQPNGNEQEIDTSGEINYDVGYTKTQMRPVGTVSDLMVAITINSSATDTRDTSSLVPLVARAAGISAEYEGDKIAIMFFPFFVAETPAPDQSGEELPGGILANLPSWALYALIAGTAMFVLLLILILVLRSRAKKRKKAEAEELERQALETYNANLAAMEAEAQEAGGDIMDLNTERSVMLRQDVRQFAEDNPAIAAQMVKNWLRGSEEQ